MRGTEKVLEEIRNAGRDVILEDLLVPGTKGIGRVFSLVTLLFKGTIKVNRTDKTVVIQ